MEVNGEISDTDSGIILHSGSDSPTTHTKDVTTHTRAMKLKHQALQDRLELCMLELKKLCIREAELTGRLSGDYPLFPGEKPPHVRRRIGAAFRLDEQSLPHGAEESELNLVDAELALQTKIFEAARKLCREDHHNKAVKRSRLQQCKREEKKLKELQETAFRLRLEHGRSSSPRPAYNITQQDLGTSDDSSLSDSAVQDEEVASQSSQPSSGLPYPAETDSPRLFPVSETDSPRLFPVSETDSPRLFPVSETDSPRLFPVSSQSSIDVSYMSPSVSSQALTQTPSQSPRPSLESSLGYDDDAPPIEHSPWSESSLDQPYQKTKKSRSSSKKKSSSPATEVLPPLEACLGHSPLPVQLSHLRLCHSQSNSTPPTPEMGLHRQLSLRLSNTDSSFGPEKDRGRTRCPRRRLTEYTVTVPEAPPAPRLNYRSHASSEDSNSERSSVNSHTYSSSPRQEMPRDLPKPSPPSFPQQNYGPVGNRGPLPFPGAGFYQNTRHQSSPSIHKGYYSEEVGYPFDADVPRNYYVQQAPCPSSRYDYWYKDVQPQRAPRPLPPDVRLSNSPSAWEQPHYRSALPRQVVNDELKSWHWRNQFKGPRPRSLDRQGAVRVKNMPDHQGSPHSQHQTYHEQMTQSRGLQRAADDTPVHWVVEDNFVSQV